MNEGRPAAPHPARVLPADGLEDLVRALRDEGYRVVGPVAREGVIAYEEIATASSLARGWTDEQAPGSYRLRPDPRGLWFGFTKGASSWKAFLFPPRLRLWRADRDEDGPRVREEPAEAPRFAFLGVRACDAAAIAVQDRVFLGGQHVDDTYRARREAAFLVAVSCSQAVSTCFCTSMGTGPRAGAGTDLSLTELKAGGPHRFLVEVGSDRGAGLLGRLPTRPASEDDHRAAEGVLAETAGAMGAPMPEGVPDALSRTLEDPHWDVVADRCLACGNCTMVCPTCFCSAVDDTTSLDGRTAERSRRWDSCFGGAHSYIHGGSVRPTTRSRYRQWMTHKLWTWQEQFGTAGCVGCGRCVTWCPAAIDLREEARAIVRAANAGEGRPAR